MKMKSSKNSKKQNFTLVEMVVSLGVFSILMLIMFQLFTSAQKAWLNSSNRSSVYQDARMALELISRDIQCIYYEQGKVPFYHHPASGAANDTEALFFVSATSIGPSYTISSKLCEIAYKFYNADVGVAKNGWLVRSVTGDAEGSNTKWNFYNTWNDPTPAIRTTPYNDASNAAYAFTQDSASSDAYNTIIPHVVNLTFKCFNKNGVEIDPTTDEVKRGTFPYSINIELSLLDPDSWKKWKALGGAGGGANADRIRDENLRTLSKTVSIGERGQTY